MSGNMWSLLQMMSGAPPPAAVDGGQAGASPESGVVPTSGVEKGEDGGEVKVKVS